MKEWDLEIAPGRTLHVYDAGGGGGDDVLAVFWHHGTPNLGAPPRPLFAAAERLGLRWISYDRPGYGGSTRQEGRVVASAADCVARVADFLKIRRFAVMGHSGGGTHALACAARSSDRVVAAVSIAGLAPYGADGLDWFAGMARSGVASLRAAVAGRETKDRYEASGLEYDPEFTPEDLAVLGGSWSWLDEVVGPAVAAGPAALVDDDLAYVAPWGADPARIVAPVLLLHGGRDRVVPSSHAEWLARRCPSAELWTFPDDGHLSILERGEEALEWLRARADAAVGGRPQP